jgi:hypothetical protein
MENEKAVVILKNILEKYSLNAGEKEAVLTAIGVLSLGISISKSRIKSLKARRNKNVQW